MFLTQCNTINNNVAIFTCWLPAFIIIMNICSLINRVLVELHACRIIGHIGRSFTTLIVCSW